MEKLSKTLIVIITIVGISGLSGIGIMWMNNTELIANNDSLQEQLEELGPLQSLYEATQQDFNSLLESFEFLNETYYRLLNEHESLFIDFNELNTTYHLLLFEYEALSESYNLLSQLSDLLLFEYETLNESYNLLLSDYQTLLADFQTLQDSHNTLVNMWTDLTIEFNALNESYWQLWQSCQPDYRVDVIELVASNTTLFIGEYSILNVTLQWTDTQEPITEGFVFVNGFQCYHVDNGTWSANVSFTEMANYVLDRVSYLDKDGYWLDVQTNGLSLEFVVWDYINLIMVQVTGLGVIGGGSTGFILKFYGLWNKTGERVDNIRVDLISNQSTTDWGWFWATQYTELFIGMSKTVTHPIIYEWLHIDFYADIYKGDCLIYHNDFKMRWW
jgi:hypothetical protein